MKICKKCTESNFYADGRCVPCTNIRNAKWRKANQEKVRLSQAVYNKNNSQQKKVYMAKWNKDNQEKVRLSNAKWKKANQEKVRLKQADYQKNNIEKLKVYQVKYAKEHKAQHSAINRKWAKANRHKGNAKTAKRKAAKLQATPSWANKFFIEEIYDLAQRRTIKTGFKWHVDHTVPLQNKLVCGLHVEHNLRVIPAIHNCSKSNHYWTGMPL